MLCPRAGLSLLTQVPRLQFCPKAGLHTANSGTKVAVLLGMNRCGSFLLLFAHTIVVFKNILASRLKSPASPLPYSEDYIACMTSSPALQHDSFLNEFTTEQWLRNRFLLDGHWSIVILVKILGFTTLLTSQVISLAFYSEHEKSDKFCSRGSNFGLRFFHMP